MDWSSLLLASWLSLFRMGAPSHKWSMQVPSDVTGEAGGSVVLPCTFTHPHKSYDGPLMAIWRVREPYDGAPVFQCVAPAASDHCRTTVSYKSKYKLLGNPRHNDLSIKIDNLTWSDSNRYFCRVEFAGDIRDRYESRVGVRLHLTASPRIVHITVRASQDQAFSALCTAEGEPPPSLTWSGPAAANGTAASNQEHQVTKELHGLAQDGRYTCTATNPYGRAEGSVYFYRFRAGAGGSFLLPGLLSSLGAKLSLLVAILGAIAFRGRGCSAAQAPASRSQAQESTYENFERRNNRGNQPAVSE
ncbi:sialic acid-binding Ig-like lectin 15 [Ornithorhynchus anatinus]|uniref:sialic acid-binding Ig-like lectin 15 n=1 Tax=Ornithorhynchus anatinus TaxID=9258 RepID=UPI0010A9230E|nr:sialic acid-binding Ig-like lectin 15 [Ornithorhynchus anatinus]